MSNWRFYLDGNEVEEPIGWDAIEFTAVRMESHGIDQPFSTEVKFYAEGAKYIKAIYDQYFINQPIAITITSDVGYNNAPYQFDGFLNLAIYQEHNVCDTDTWEITVGIIDDQFREKFKSRGDVQINILENKDLDGNTIPDADWENIRLHRSDLYIVGSGRNLAEVSLLPEYNSSDILPPYDWLYPDYIQTFPVYWSSSDFANPVGSTFDTQGISYGDSNVIFKNNTAYARTIKFAGNVNGQWRPFDRNCGGTANWEAVFRVHEGSGGINTFYTVYTSPAYGNGTPLQPYSFNFSLDIYVPPGYVVAFLCYWGTGGTIQREVPTNTFPFLCQSTLEVNVENLCIVASEINSGEYASFCDVLRVENFFKRIIQKLTGSNNKLLSDTFSKTGDGCYWNNALTNGLRIRNAITIQEAETGCGDTPVANQNQSIFNTSWDKAFDSLDKIFCLGWAFEWTGSEWKIRVESREYFYQNIVSQTFENVGELNQIALSDKLINHIKIGYTDNWKNRNTGGAWAIMTERDYFIDNRAMSNNSSNLLDLRSEIVAEGYAIEFSRRLQFYESGAISSDRPNDYDTFIIWMNRITYSGSDIADTPFQIQTETGAYSFAPGTVSMPSNYISYSGSPMQGLYNIYHTPARIACRWWKVLGMHTFGMVNPILRFQTGEYQVTYSSTINYPEEKESCIEPFNGGIIENWNISPSILKPEYQDYLFKPIQVEFEYPQSLCDFLTLSQDEQYRKVKLTSGSLAIEGFILNATNQPENASGGTTKFTLLVSNQQSEPGGAFDEGYDTGYVVE